MTTPSESEDDGHIQCVGMSDLIIAGFLKAPLGPERLSPGDEANAHDDGIGLDCVLKAFSNSWSGSPCDRFGQWLGGVYCQVGKVLPQKLPKDFTNLWGRGSASILLDSLHSLKISS
jgi:hypothetical protein